MAADVVTHELRVRRAPLLALCVGLGVLAVAALGAAAGLQDGIDDLTENLPEALLAFIPADVPGGYVVGEVFNLIGPAAVVAYAVVVGAGAVAGEEQAGTMAVLASLPLSRRGLLLQKGAALAVGLVVVVAVLGAASLLAEAVLSIGLEASGILATCVHLLLLGLALGAIALAVGAATGSPGLATGVGAAVAVLAYVGDAMLPLAGLDGWARLSPWYYYASSTPLANGLDPAHAAVLLVLALLGLAVAVVGIERRDLRG